MPAPTVILTVLGTKGSSDDHDSLFLVNRESSAFKPLPGY